MKMQNIGKKKNTRENSFFPPKKSHHPRKACRHANAKMKRTAKEECCWMEANEWETNKQTKKTKKSSIVFTSDSILSAGDDSVEMRTCSLAFFGEVAARNCCSQIKYWSNADEDGRWLKLGRGYLGLIKLFFLNWILISIFLGRFEINVKFSTNFDILP